MTAADMAGYVPYHRKKLELLYECEDDLQRLVDRGASQKALLKMSLRLRDCHVRVLRAKQNDLYPLKHTEFDKLQEKIVAMRALTADTILEDFLLPKSARKRAIRISKGN